MVTAAVACARGYDAFHRFLVAILVMHMSLILSITYLKNNLRLHGCVVKQFKMLTYSVYAPLLNRSTPYPEP